MDLNSARTEINNIDREIVLLLEKRFDAVMEIGQYKKENNIPVYDGKREQAVIESCVGYLKNKSYSKCITDIYRQIIGSSKELEK